MVDSTVMTRARAHTGTHALTHACKHAHTRRHTHASAYAPAVPCHRHWESSRTGDGAAGSGEPLAASSRQPGRHSPLGSATNVGSIMALNIPGVIVMVFFYLLVLAIGIWASFKSKKEAKKGHGDKTEMALLGNRGINLVVGIFTMTGG